MPDPYARGLRGIVPKPFLCKIPESRILTSLCTGLDTPGIVGLYTENERNCILQCRKCYLSCIVTKPTKWHVLPAKTQISLGICPV